jgi:hypothetical protein
MERRLTLICPLALFVACAVKFYAVEGRTYCVLFSHRGAEARQRSLPAVVLSSARVARFAVLFYLAAEAA